MSEQDKKDLEDLLTVTIPYPSYVPRARGPHALGKFGTYLKVACTREEKSLVDAAADKMGMKVAELIRWSTVHVAKEIMK